MLLPTSQTYTFDIFELTNGTVLPKLDVAYETWGTLNDTGDNAILLCHGYKITRTLAVTRMDGAITCSGPAKRSIRINTLSSVQICWGRHMARRDRDP